MLRAHKKHELSEKRTVDLTAMIDVVFQLLLFFMLTSNLVKPNRIELKLPESTSGVKVADEQRFIVSYRIADGLAEVKLNDEVIDGLDHLGDALAALADPAQTPSVDVRIDKSVPWEDGIAVMDELREAGFGNLSLNTLARGGMPAAGTGVR